MDYSSTDDFVDAAKYSLALPARVLTSSTVKRRIFESEAGFTINGEFVAMPTDREQ
jgi:hypothetical protein